MFLMSIVNISDNLPPLAIYIHWPFCLKKCPYCDFNSHVRAAIDHDSWGKSFITELAHYAKIYPDRRITSIYFGGGTPSLMEPRIVASVIDKIVELWGVTPDCEITLEANPTSVETGKLADMARAGVNRVSMGIQALDDDALKFLGREHNVAEALRALEVVQENFARSSFDLITGRPEQTEEEWRAELQHTLEIERGHLSIYHLTIEKNTQFFTQFSRGDFSLPDDDFGAHLFEITQEIMSDAGLPAYEISNHARVGEKSRHNLTYWNYRDYLGVGPGAHGRITDFETGEKYAMRTHRAPEIYQKKVLETEHGRVEMELLRGDMVAREAYMMGLRAVDGVSMGRLERISGVRREDILDMGGVGRLVDSGDLIFEGDDRLYTSLIGRLRLNAVLGYILK